MAVMGASWGTFFQKKTPLLKHEEDEPRKKPGLTFHEILIV